MFVEIGYLHSSTFYVYIVSPVHNRPTDLRGQSADPETVDVPRGRRFPRRLHPTGKYPVVKLRISALIFNLANVFC